MQEAPFVVERVFRAESGRILATLIGVIGDFSLAEDALQDALVDALRQWPRTGVPRQPAAWLTAIARRRAIDRLRRDATLLRKQETLQALARLDARGGEMVGSAADEALGEETIPDERLALLFTCCHPALPLEAQVALTLRTLGGLTTDEVASAFLVSVPTMAQRLLRAKRKIREAGIPYRVPSREALAERLEGVLTVLYLIFNEGYSASTGDALVRHELCGEAIRLGRVLVALQEQEPALAQEAAETLGLLALMLLHNSRRQARVDTEGALILLEEQDRRQWNREEIAEGIALLDRALLLRRPGPYQIQAAIAALHAQAERAQDTDWRQIALLYQSLARLTPSPIVELNRAAAVAMSDGPEEGLRLLEALHLEESLASYHLFYAARADLLRRAGRMEEATVDYAQALRRCENGAERRFLQRRLSALAKRHGEDAVEATREVILRHSEIGGENDERRCDPAD
jgi:RNA polymerase sigma-70 factor (ECF subfamily)